jgi:hypothetical protein
VLVLSSASKELAGRSSKDIADRIEQLAPDWIHVMRGSTIEGRRCM